MGSIDENALQSLSLVINLTKHIQIKASGINGDIDPEEYSRYFPSFMWVVRDFALQLQDPDGETITPKEYLEKALTEQKGFSESTDQKNRIRRLLKCFFKERDCTTVIRPLTDEDGLQNLENKEFDSLRDEFKTQIIQLRNKIMKRIKPKTVMGGQKMTGSMYANLVTNYVDAINKGAVPSIENAWSYISKNECQKAMQNSYTYFCEEFTHQFETNTPMYEYELKEFYKEIKDAAIEMYDNQSVGDVSEEFKKDLKTQFKQKYSLIKSENAKEARKCSQVFLQQCFAPIEDRLRNQEYSEFNDFEKEVREVETHFMERGPAGDDKKAIVQEFIISSLIDGSDYFLRKMSNELNLQTSLNKESVTKLEARIQELKADYEKLKDDSDKRNRQLENDKAQLAAKEQSMRENFNEIKKEKENIEKDSKAKIQAERTESSRLVEEYKNRMYASEESAKEAQRRMMSSESEHDKQKALLEQKVQFMENNIDTLKQKEKDYQSEIKTQKKELLANMKDSTTKLEEKIQDLNKNLEQAQEDLTTKDNEISNLEQKVYISTSTINEKEIELQSLRQLSEEYDTLKDDHDNLKREIEENKKIYNQELQDERDSLKFEVEELNLKITENESKYNSEKSKLDKDITIYKQKIEFLNVQVEEAKKQIEENRNNHESMMKAIQNKESEKGEAIEEADKKIEQIKAEHVREIKDFEDRYETTTKRLKEELEKSRQAENDAKMNLKITNADTEKEIGDLTESLNEITVQRDNALEELKKLDSSKQSLIQQTEERYKSIIQQLESEIEQKDMQNKNDIEDQQKRAEEDLTQLKSFYDIEKDRLEKRLQEEKEKAQRNLAAAQTQFDQMLKDEQEQHEDEMLMLQDELRDKEDHLQTLTNRFEHESSLNEQKIASLESHLKETKKALDDIQDKNASAMDHQLESFNKERRELLDKADEFSQNMTEKEKRITALENQNESLTSQIEKKDEDLESIRLELSGEKQSLTEKIEKLREENQKLSDEVMAMKLKSGREEALKDQQIEYQEKRIQELLKTLSDANASYQERLHSQKTELGDEVDSKVKTITAEKEKISLKYEEKRKQLKEIEKEYTVVTTRLEREQAVATEKIENLERKLEAEIENHKKSVDAYREQLVILKNEKGELSEVVETKYNNLKAKYDALEKENSELNSKYEREEALWKGKHEFLEDQRNELKKDLVETNKKLEQSIQQLQTKISKKDGDQKQIDIFNHMEKEYKEQISNMQDAHERYVKEITDKNKELENKYNTIQEKYELTVRDGNSLTRNMEKRLNDFEQKEKSYIEEIAKLKEERDNTILRNQTNLDKERDTNKMKIYELERKLKETESKKSSFLFEMEKEKAKWSYEKESFEANKNDLLETVSRLQKKNETLIAQVEKLKERTKNTRRNKGYGGVNSSIIESNFSTRYGTNKFAGVKELDADNYSNSSNKGTRLNTFTKFIGDGKEHNDKKSIGSGDDDAKMNLESTPENSEKKSGSELTVSPSDD